MAQHSHSHPPFSLRLPAGFLLRTAPEAGANRLLAVECSLLAESIRIPDEVVDLVEDSLLDCTAD